MARNTKVVLAVLLLHIAAIWALHSGLLRKVVELVVPAEIIVEMAAPEETSKVKEQLRIEKQVTTTPQTKQAVPEPVVLAVADKSAPSSEQVYVPPPVAAPAPQTQATPSAAATPAPAIVLPSTDADYLNNPKPPYPGMSKRLREQGKVVIRALIGADGTAQQAEIKQSSGFERLDQAALTTVKQWRYVPGKRGGVAEAMWFNVPITFELTN